MRRRLLTVLLTISMIATMMPVFSYAATELPSIDDKAVLYTPYSDYRNGDCVLTSCKSMFRRFAIGKGSLKWTTITNSAIRPYAAPTGGLKYTFDYSNDGIKYHVEHGYFKGSTEAEKKAELATLLKSHKEGVIVWGQNMIPTGPHAVLAVAIKNGVIYAVDSSYNRGYKNNSYSCGVQKWDNTTMYSFGRIYKYWRITSATGKSTSAENQKAESTMQLNAVTTPSVVKQGEGFTMRGMIDSNYLITKVNVTILDADGNKVISKTVKPNSWLYDIHSSLDPIVKFGTLLIGDYTYRITATDEKQTAILHENAFEVTKTGKASTDTSASTLSISGVTSPIKVVKGDGFTMKGVVSSNVKLSKVQVDIIDSEGNAVISKSVAPGGKTCDINNTLDSKVKFGTLGTGKYTYRITATDEEQTAVLHEAVFTVVNSSDEEVSTETTEQNTETTETTDTTDTETGELTSGTDTATEEAAEEPASTLKISGATKPSNMKKGTSFTIKGKIKSNYKIKTVNIKVTNEDGKHKYNKCARPNAKTYDLAELDPQIKFGSLPVGKYTYKVTVRDEKQKLVLVKKTFNVTSPSKLKISSASIPTTIKKGGFFSVKGKVTSNCKITRVTVTVTTKKGAKKLSATARPKTKSYNLKKLDSKLMFGTLPKGTYIYKVVAVDTKQKMTLIEETFKVK